MKRRPPATPRAIAVDLLSAVLDKGRLLDEVLDDSRLASLDERDRGFVRMLLGTSLRRLGQIDDLIAHCVEKPMRAGAAWAEHALRLGICQLLFLDMPPHAAISTTVDLVKGGSQAGFAKLLNAVLRRLDREGREKVEAQDAALLNTPEWLWRSWVRAYGEETARAIASAHLAEAPVDITVAADGQGWAEKLEAEILPTGSLRRAAGGSIAALPGFDQAAWWVQDAAAALPARLLGDVRGKSVADLCAAPGGKALQLAVAGAQVTAVDRSGKRLVRLGENLKRLGLSATVVEADAGAWTPPQPFDAILLDAPCSATGTLRRHPDVARHKTPAEVMKLAGVQARLLRAAIPMLKPGGTLVYCTCSLEPEEGAEQIAALLAEGAPLKRIPIRPEEVGGMAELITADGDLRTLPCHLAGQGGMDAFFAARLEKIS
ncbi:putative ribosomal RNA small subunit methyltransferase B [Magnetospirillum sp. XM-1]|uniref:RsmB/NOP family class I SAM-dependent RNA methyltransferase n=1 Tax=Magnetospirillum sp. XM-1 TaxID=1663591 RepID=UPI00073DC274|nr:transcription antitermination factor NusB [Magnetospirillum sp. XM-1]CUW38110.1 putative ribosomal RNA small subunit methyltransferase B [Magnetospirillum sp. XM-1]